jgi:hypothetical protein
MRTDVSAPRKLVGAATVALTLGLAMVAAGCGGGGDGDETAFTPVAGTESAYCDTHRAWQVHELDGGEGDEQPNPAALKRYWNDYLEFNKTSLRQAPPVIRDEWVLSERGVRTIVTPVLEKYEFDFERIMREGTPAEKAVSEPPPRLQKAQDTIHAYEARVCGVNPPPAANVVFKADDSSRAYCTALNAYNSQLEKVESSRFDPDAMRTLLTADSFTEGLDELDATAPAAIAADVEAETEWYRGRWSDVIAEYDYDVRRIWLDASPEDRAVFNETHPDVVEHASRTTAYEEQVCAK